MANLDNENKSINNLSKDAVDGKELKGGQGAPGSVDPMDGIEAGWLDPNDPMSGDIHHPPFVEGEHPGVVGDPFATNPLNPTTGGPLDGPVGQVLPPTVV